MIPKWEEKLIQEYLRDNSYGEILELVKSIAENEESDGRRRVFQSFIKLSEEDHNRVKELEEEVRVWENFDSVGF